MEGIDLLISGVVGIVMIGIIAGFGLDMLGDQRETSCDAGYTYNATAQNCYLNTNGSVKVTTTELNATNDAIEGVAKIPAKLPLVAGAIVAAVVIFLLIRYFKAN